jgi:dipeptidyl aminopeptidase/acylaminoacyl peptidase
MSTRNFVPLAVALVATFAFADAAPAAEAAAPQRAPADQPIPIQDFIRHARFNQSKLSPTGAYIAINQQIEGVNSLAVLRADTLAPVGNITLPDEKSVGQFYWVGDERLMFTAQRNIGSRAAPVGTGEWFSVNADGSKPRVIVAYVGADATQRNKATGAAGYSMLDPLPGDGHPLMERNSSGGSEQVNSEVERFDPVCGTRVSVGRAPRDNCSFALDEKKLPRWTMCSDAEDDQGNFGEHLETYRREDNGRWTLVNRSQTSGKRLNVLGTARDGRVYATLDDMKAPAAFGTVDATGKFTELFRDPVSEVADYIVSADGDTILGLVTMAGPPKVTLLDAEADNPDQQIYASLAQSFPGKWVDFTSATEDGSKILFAVRDDSSPSELYLYDRATKKARFLLRNADWLDPARMSQIKSFSFQTRDGVTMYGYLTVPHGRKLENLPMILNVHGGPIGPRDDWGFNGETQLLASRGYLVLQLNYRGSGGFGQAFQDMGHREWGGAMQDDLTDVVRWAVQKGYADPQRVCIYGGSYGGYASLMGVAKDPDLYACAAGYVGVYDMVMMNKVGDIRQRETGREFLAHTLGADKQARLEFSPVHQAAKIKAPVFLAAGMKDQRAPYQHTEAMRDALKAAGHPPDVVILQAGEGHGFYNEENNLNFYTKLLAFFDRYIGDRRGHVEVETVESAGAEPPKPAEAEPADKGGAD